MLQGGDIPFLRGGVVEPHRHLATQLPGKGNDLGNGQVQRFGNLLAQFKPRQQAHQLGVLVDRHVMLAGQCQDGFGQRVIPFGTQGWGLLTVIAQGNGLARLFVVHAFSSTQRCSSRVRGPCGGMPG
ncbi:hypothetical protein D3C71_1527170 [compost metagenome]